MRGYHDIGGLDLGPINRSEHDYALWEKRVDAMLVLLWQHKRILTVDEHRYAQETVGAAEYEKMTYYERWMLGLTKVLLSKGVITTDELAQKLAEIATRKNA